MHFRRENLFGMKTCLRLWRQVTKRILKLYYILLVLLEMVEP